MEISLGVEGEGGKARERSFSASLGGEGRGEGVKGWVSFHGVVEPVGNAHTGKKRSLFSFAKHLDQVSTIRSIHPCTLHLSTNEGQRQMEMRVLQYVLSG